MKLIDFVTATSIADNDYVAMADTNGNTKKISKANLVPIVNNLTSTTTGSALDSTQGKILDDKITTNTTDINTLKDEVNKTSLTNIEIGASPITSLTGMLDGFVDTLIFKGKTMYKTSGGTYTDTYASGVTIESTGESEGKMIMTSLKPDNSVGDTLNASVSKPLRSQGLVKDIYNVVNKTITRYIGQMTFKGASTESWVLGTPPLSTNTLQFKIQIADGKVGLSPTDVNLMCDKFVSDTSANNISNDAEGIAFDDNGYVLVRILKSKLATQDVAGFKLWLASVNTTIVYQLLNSVTETVKKVPTLQTFKDGYLQLQNAIIPTVNFNYSVELASVVSEHTRVIDELEDVVVDNVNKIGDLTTDYKKINSYWIDTGIANTYVITPNPAITSYSVGQIFRFKVVNANTGASTLNVNGLGTKAIVKNGNSALVSGDMPNGAIITAIYDGTNFQINAINDIKLNNHLNETIVYKTTASRDAQTTGTQTITLPFTPKFVQIKSIIWNTQYMSIGDSDGVSQNCMFTYSVTGNYASNGGATVLINDGTNYTQATVTFGVNSLILNWSKVGTTVTGNITLDITAITH